MKLTFKQKAFALLVASLYLRLVFFVVENGNVLLSDFGLHQTSSYDASRWYVPPVLPPPPHTHVGNDVEKAVDNFHHKFNHAAFLHLYREAEPSFTRYNSLEYVRRMIVVWQKLGEVKSCEQFSRYESRMGGNVTQVILDYNMHFANGDGYEQFIWNVTGDEVKLSSHTISSPLLGY